MKHFIKSLVSMFRRGSLTIAFVAALWISAFALATDWYVDGSAGTNGSGSDTSPFNNLESALTNPSLNDLDHILIAQGTYKPTTGTDRTISFVIGTKNVSLKGGWIVGTPWTHSGNPALTILSGNINNTGIATDNSYTVLKLSHSGATNSGTLIEYLTITGGFANDGAGQDSGGGVRITNGAAPRLHQCRIANNFAGSSANASSGGAGVYVNAASPVLTRCTIEFNAGAANFVGRGGGLLSTGASTVRMIDCTIHKNSKVL